ncbi:MAG: FecR domain-containing protein [Sphingobium sp.]
MADDREPRPAQESRDALDRQIEAFVRARSDAPAAASRSTDDVARFWDGLTPLEADPSVQAMLAEARGRIEGGARILPFRRRMRAPFITALAASLVLGLGIGTWQLMRDRGPESAPASRTLANGSAAPRTVRLADGSMLTLDAQSAVTIPAWTTDRQVVLTGGRAYFNVVHDTQRPFVVIAAGNRIVDVGTAFSVETDSRATRVSLVEGAVRVTPARAAAVVDMKPDDALTLDASGTYRMTRVDAAAQSEWRSGRITFDNQPVSEVLARMNRYFADELVLADKAQGRMAISGTFRLDDRADVLNAFALMGLKVESGDRTGQ